MTFQQWAMAKYQEASKNINPCDDKGNLDPVRLNEVLTGFAQHFAWAITMQEIEANKLNQLNHEFENWRKRRYNDALRSIMQEQSGTRVPAQTTVEARIVDTAGEELEERQKAVTDQKSRVDLLKGMVKVLDKQASILQTLSSNMRSEMFFAGGVSLDTGGMSPAKANTAAKTLLRSAMRGQGQDPEASQQATEEQS